MQTTVKLQEPFSYSIYPILIILILLIIASIYLFKRKDDNKLKEVPQIRKKDIKDINKIKQKYINKLDILQTKLEKEKISIRKAYQYLSELIRYFVYEVTEIKVQNYTLKEIETLNIPMLYNLIKEYYTPEFANISSGNVKESIERTREVIKKWN